LRTWISIGGSAAEVAYYNHYRAAQGPLWRRRGPQGPRGRGRSI